MHRVFEAYAHTLVNIQAHTQAGRATHISHLDKSLAACVCFQASSKKIQFVSVCASVCVCCLCMCVCMLRICCIVLLLLPPLVQPASSALFWSSLGHKTTTYLLARARLSFSFPPLSLSLLSLCLCESVYSLLVSPGNRFYLAAVCLFACLLPCRSRCLAFAYILAV